MPDGTLYFVDRHFQRIHGWTAAAGLTVVRDSPLDPVNLAVDALGRSAGAVVDGPGGNGL